MGKREEVSGRDRRRSVGGRKEESGREGEWERKVGGRRRDGREGGREGGRR